VAPTEAPRLQVELAGSGALARVDVVRTRLGVLRIELDGGPLASLERTLEPTVAGDVIYVRVLQQDGGMAWSSPFFVGGDD
jgi:hypothetical protein